ncbi:MAG TPA: hypothetical protein VF487_13450 [Chitinophagaceae bacterium]
MTATEILVSDLCKSTFLSFWSFPNPIGKKLDKELCDILVVCDPDIIIFSVKEINIKDSGDHDIDFDRWERKAIDESVAQIYGAERIIKQKEEILLKDKTTKIKLPGHGIRNIYRVAVAFGRGDRFPLKVGDFGKGFVHVFDERSIKIVLEELDTVTDFINFLKAKEEFTAKGIRQIAFSGEDYLGMYLDNGFDIPGQVDLLLLDSDYWINFSNSKEYKKEKDDNAVSYLWDKLIETLCKDFESGSLLDDIKRNELEIAIRLMNKETRFGRRQMSKMISEVIGDGNIKPKVKARIVFSELENAPLYVIMVRPLSDREFGRKELHLRCLVARSLFKDRTKVIGLATEHYEKGKGYSLDLLYMDMPELTEEQINEAEQIKNDLGYFKSPSTTRLKPNGDKIK